MLNYEQFIKLEDKNKVILLLNEVSNILDNYKYNTNHYIFNMDRLKTSISQSLGYVNMLIVDYFDTNEDK